MVEGSGVVNPNAVEKDECCNNSDSIKEIDEMQTPAPTRDEHLFPMMTLFAIVTNTKWKLVETTVTEFPCVLKDWYDIISSHAYQNWSKNWSNEYNWGCENIFYFADEWRRIVVFVVVQT